MKKMISFLTVFVFMIAFSINANAQLANTYVYSTSTGATLEDMTGSTQLIGAGVDDSPSALTAFPGGFSFTYEGTGYTDFSVTPDGFMKLGAPVTTSQFSNSITSTSNRPKVFAMWDDLATGTDGNVIYKMFGTSPNRKFVVQWFVTIPRATGGAANSTFQVWLHESGVIEFVYGNGGSASSSSVGINSVAANASNFQSITTLTNLNSTSTANNSNSAWPGNGRKYTYDLPTQCAISIVNLNPFGTQFPGCSSITVAPKVNITNGGLSGQTGITVTYAVASESYSETVGVADLAAGANTDVTFPATLNIDPNSPGVKAVTVTVNSTCSGPQVYTLNTSYTVSTANVNFGGPIMNYYFANSTAGASCAPDQPVYAWEDTTGSTSLVLDGVDVSGGLIFGTLDDGFFALGNILSGDFFRYAGVDYDSFFVGTNGMIAFSRTNNTQGQLTTFTPLAIPSALAPRPAIFPFWKDFRFNDADIPVNRLSYKVVPGKLIITYDRAANYNTGIDAEDYVSFQIILHTSPVPVEDGLIYVEFNEAGTGSSFIAKYNDGTLPTHTVGIQNLAGDDAIQYRRANPVTGGPLFGSSMALAFGINNNALPVELASFTSSVSGRDVTLNWATASELNNSGFDIERSADNNSWSKVANVSGNGTSSVANNYSYTDRNLASGSYSYRLKQIDFNGNFEYFNLNSEVNVGVPNAYALSQNYPNPFNPSTKINYDLPFDSKVSVKLFDMSGREVMTLVNETKTAGYYSVNFNGSNLSSGVYFYTISADGNGNNFVMTKKMTLIK